MKRIIVWYALALAALCGQLAVWPAQATRPAQQIVAPAPPLTLVKDINIAPQLQSSLSATKHFGTINNRTLFNAFTPQAGNELWASDGTPGGTQLVKDILPGENGALDFGNVQSFVLNGQLLFAPNDGARGAELWASDGTAEGTQLLKDLFPGADSGGPQDFVAFGNRAFFRAQVAESQWSLWISDGTPGGTTLLHAFARIDSAPVLTGNTLFFSAAETGRDVELWKSDGTAAGTVLVKDIWLGRAGSLPSSLFAYSASEVWFSASDGTTTNELWRSDGTPGGTQRFLAPALSLPITNPSQFVGLHRAGQIGDTDKILFNASDGTHGQELWKTDGTPAGTVLVQNIARDAGGIFLYPGNNAGALGDKLVFGVDAGASSAVCVARAKTRIPNARAGCCRAGGWRHCQPRLE